MWTTGTQTLSVNVLMWIWPLSIAMLELQPKRCVQLVVWLAVQMCINTMQYSCLCYLSWDWNYWNSGHNIHWHEYCTLNRIIIPVPAPGGEYCVGFMLVVGPHPPYVHSMSLMTRILPRIFIAVLLLCIIVNATEEQKTGVGLGTRLNLPKFSSCA